MKAIRTLRGRLSFRRVNRAQSVYDNAAARQKQVDAAWIELTNALASLTPRLTNAQLSAVIAVVEAAFPAGDYNDQDFGTYNAYLAALEAARLVAAQENASEAEIKAALAGIETATGGLRVRPSGIDVSVMGCLDAQKETYIDGDHFYTFFSDSGDAAAHGCAAVRIYTTISNPNKITYKDTHVITPITAYKNGARGLVFKDDAEALAVLTDTAHTPADQEKYNFSLTNLIPGGEPGAETRYTSATRAALAAAATQAGEILDAYLAGQTTPGDGDEETTPGDGDEETTPGMVMKTTPAMAMKKPHRAMVMKKHTGRW